MCIRPKPPLTGQIIHLPPARPVRLVAALQWRNADVQIACMIDAVSDDDPSPTTPAAAKRCAPTLDAEAA